MLPDNVFLANGISNTVVISVEILPLNSKSYEIATTSIQKLNLGAGLTCVFSTANIDVGVKGTDEQLESLSTDQIKASVDLNGLEAGTYTLPVAITLPSGYEQVEDVTVNATLSEIGTAAAGPASISAAVSTAS
jgi:YbbR domain-containing protein